MIGGTKKLIHLLRDVRSEVGLVLAMVAFLLPACAEHGPDLGMAAPPDNAGTSSIRPFERFAPPEDHMPAEVLATTPPARSASPEDWLEDVTESSGIRFTYHTGLESRQYAMVEELGGGVALFDFDNDGDLDVYLTGGGAVAKDQVPQGHPDALFRNDGGLRFTEVTHNVGLDQAADYSHGVTVGDFDRDGWIDLFVTAYGRSRLYRNVEGRTFVDQTADVGLDIDGWYTSATFLDFNNDGWLDLYVCGYVAWKPGMTNYYGDPKLRIREASMPSDVAGVPDLLFRGSSTGRFTNVSTEAGIIQNGRGLGVVAADLNADGWVDLYVANDVGPNHLYWGGPQLPFQEAALFAGVMGSEHGIPESSMGVDTGDYNGDGLLDLFVTNYEREDNSLYRNEGGGLFTHRSVSAGLAGGCRPYVGFATEFIDLDMDGWLDLYVLNGHVLYHARQSPYRQPAVIFRNLRGERFVDVSDRAAPYFAVTHVGRGAAHGDLDNDGDLDLIIVHQNEPVTVLCNRLTPENWLCLALEGVASNRDAIGAVMTSQWEERTLTRVIRGGGSYLSCSDRRVLVPCSSDLQSVDILWPSGRRDRFSGLQPGRRHNLREGAGDSLAQPESRPAPRRNGN
jgi:enediyne biosynthesis protein E4